MEASDPGLQCMGLVQEADIRTLNRMACVQKECTARLTRTFSRSAVASNEYRTCYWHDQSESNLIRMATANNTQQIKAGMATARVEYTSCYRWYVHDVEPGVCGRLL
jgi:hypothetical protein